MKIIQDKGDGACGEAVTSVKALRPFVGSVGGYRGSLRPVLSGPQEECRDELLADATAAMGWINVNAFQVGHPDRVHTARPAEAPDQMTYHVVTVAGEQYQVLVTGKKGGAVRDAGLGGPAQIGRGGVVHSGIGCDERLSRGENVRDIVRSGCTDPDRHSATLPSAGMTRRPW